MDSAAPIMATRTVSWLSRWSVGARWRVWSRRRLMPSAPLLASRASTHSSTSMRVRVRRMPAVVAIPYWLAAWASVGMVQLIWIGAAYFESREMVNDVVRKIRRNNAA